MRPKRIRTSRPSLWFVAALLFAGGCGGGGGDAAPPPRPTIEAATAERLAATSDEIADLLDAGDVCTAAGRADELLSQATESVNAGAVPTRFQEELVSKANELVNEVNCPPPPEPAVDDAGEDDGEDEGRGKDKKKKQKDDDEDVVPTVEVPPVEDE